MPFIKDLQPQSSIYSLVLHDVMVVPGVTQGERAGAGHQAGAGGHGPAGDHQGDQHHAAVRQPLRRQVLRQLLQEHRPVGEG